MGFPFSGIFYLPGLILHFEGVVAQASIILLCPSATEAESKLNLSNCQGVRVGWVGWLTKDNSIDFTDEVCP